MQKNRFISMFTKSVIAFFAIGIGPLFLMGFSIYSAYSETMKQTLLSNLSQMTLYVGKNASDILTKIGGHTQYIYNYQITDYDYFYELIQDTEISETKRSAMAADVLGSIVYMDPYIDHVMFVTADGRQYTSMRPPEIMVNQNALAEWHQKNASLLTKKVCVIPTHTTDYFFYSKVFDFSLARNIMNTRTIKSAESEVLGTLYIDVNRDYLQTIIHEVNFGPEHEIMIVDKKQEVFVYQSKDYNLGRDVEDLKQWLPEMTDGKQYVKGDGNYLIYHAVPESDWIVIDKVAVNVIENTNQAIRSNTLFLLFIGGVLLGVIYLFYSRRTNQPIRKLTEAMNRIQKGDLDTQVEICTNDEVGVVADGLNQMLHHLREYINRVYVAEINQRNAELEALKTQIQPHYLYNTLDVIRMMAITNDDTITADMLSSLSAQLKYLIGTTRDMVYLKEELDNICNYFNLIRVRFDNRFELEIAIPEELLGHMVPQLILQPIVENAVNHGLRPKQGEGRIAIQGKQINHLLEITVMDDGIGMSEGELERVKELLNSPQPGKRTNGTWESIGIKNVYDRIQLVYGAEYGLTINSYEGMGTIVKYRLPIGTAGNGAQHVSDSTCG